MRRANDLGLRSKRHRFNSGRIQGGNRFSRGQIYALPRNPIYIGKIRHKSKVWDGQHEPILDETVWERIQEKLQAARTRPRGRKTASWQFSETLAAPLTGKLRDETGDRLTPTHTWRHERQIRYYVSNRLISGGTDPRGWRLPAPALESAVANAIARHISQVALGHRFCARPNLQSSDTIKANAQRLYGKLSEGAQNLLQNILDEGRIDKHCIELRLKIDGLADALGILPDQIDHAVLAIQAPFKLRRRGVEGKVAVGDREPQPDRTLLRALSRTQTWTADLRRGNPLSEIAAATSHSESYIRTRSHLAFLSPAIQSSIFARCQPTNLTLERIIRKSVPLDWNAQARLYGFEGGAWHP